jgi:NAD(P)-dependent dehydrogenase (short-subunit alcohol dehydrogenase family)
VTSVGALDGRVIVVTGAGRGIGAAVAQLCAAEGAQLVVNDAGVAVDGTGGDAGPARDMAEKITEAGGIAVPHPADVSVTEQAEDLIQTAVSEFGRLDVLINVAGIIRDRDLTDLSEEDWDAVISVHLRGTFNTSRAAARHWRDNRRGGYRLINTTSAAGYFGAPMKPNYAAAKMGIIGFTYSCANALMRYGVTANAIAPSGSTRMNSWKVRDPIAPENAAPTYVYVASTRSDWLTGHVLAARDQSIRLLNRPRYISEVVTNDSRWRLDEVFGHFEKVFRPAVENADNPYEADARRTAPHAPQPEAMAEKGTSGSQ